MLNRDIVERDSFWFSYCYV